MDGHWGSVQSTTQPTNGQITRIRTHTHIRQQSPLQFPPGPLNHSSPAQGQLETQPTGSQGSGCKGRWVTAQGARQREGTNLWGAPRL